MSEKIRKLQKEIEAEKVKMSRCCHNFGKVFYNPEIVKEGYGVKQDGAGSDPHWTYEGYRDVEKPRWTRVCGLCGYEQHTYKQKNVVIEEKKEPDFS